MFNHRLKTLSFALLLCGISAPTFAAEAAAEADPDWTFPSSISFVSDYIFRGQSQTWGKPAAQISVEANHKTGIYGGFFASNVSDQWLPGANLETDLYAGFRSMIPKTEIAYDVGAIYYMYPGADWKDSGFNPPAFPAGTTKGNKLNTGEAYAGLTYKWFNVKTGIAFTEYWGWNTNNSGLGFGFAGDPGAGVTGSTKGSYYYETNLNYEVLPSWTLVGQLGRQEINNSTGLDITYYKAGVSKAFANGWTLAGFYSGTNEPDAYKDFLSLRNTTSTSDIAKDKFFVSISRAF